MTKSGATISNREQWADSELPVSSTAPLPVATTPKALPESLSATQFAQIANQPAAPFDLFSWLYQYISPASLFLSALVSFAVCSWFGYGTTLTNQFKHFERFYQGISPDSDFYPTISEIRAIANSKVHGDQILVIVGGNSIFNGIGQPGAGLWTRKLQQLLGPNYVVVNAAFRGTYPFEAAYVSFESLIKEHPRSIYVTVTSPTHCSREVISKTYSYFYWDALTRDLLLEDVSRAACIADQCKRMPRKDADWHADMLTGGAIDRFAYFKDLWNTLGYKQIFTVWNPLFGCDAFAPRRRSEDKESEPVPIAKRFGNVDAEMKIIREVSDRLFVKDSTSKWVEAPAQWQRFAQECQSAVPESLRSRVLVVTMNNCPFYLERLSIDERQRNTSAYYRSVEVWQKAGYWAMASGMDFKAEDFADRSHLSVSGGKKLASQTAAKISGMCHDLGFGSQ